MNRAERAALDRALKTPTLVFDHIGHLEIQMIQYYLRRRMTFRVVMGEVV